MCEVKFQLTYSSGGAIDASKALREVNSIFHRHTQAAPPSYGMVAANLYEPPPPSYQAAQASNNRFAGKVYFEYFFISSIKYYLKLYQYIYIYKVDDIE
ncbi:unnamed protein product [Rotaria sp. Silwood1]|nr:unnamed protein product [Rotaria sp. Silwood1]